MIIDTKTGRYYAGRDSYHKGGNTTSPARWCRNIKQAVCSTRLSAMRKVCDEYPNARIISETEAGRIEAMKNYTGGENGAT